MSIIISSLEKVDIRSLLPRNFTHKPLLLGTFGSDVDRVLINTTIAKSMDWREAIFIDTTGYYLRFQKFFENSIPLVLGYNYSIPVFNLLSNDPYLRTVELSEIFKISFHISDQAARILQQALISMVNRGVYEPSIEDVILEIESQSQISSYKSNVYRLLRLLDVLTWGRVGAAFSGGKCPKDIEGKVIFVGLHLLPREYRVLASFILLLSVLEEEISIVVEDSDLLFPGLVRALREEYALAFERTFFILDLIKRSQWLNLILSCRSPGLISPRVRIKFNYAFSSIPHSREEFTFLFNYFPFSSFNPKLIERTPPNCFLVFYDGRVKVSELLFKSIPDLMVKVDELIKPVKPKVTSMLQRLFRNLSEAAFYVLSFLSQGSADRDTLISYIVGVLGLESNIAQRIINSLSAYGLVFEVIGRDGKYYFKITPSGIAALNEYLSYRGEET